MRFVILRHDACDASTGEQALMLLRILRNSVPVGADAVDALVASGIMRTLAQAFTTFGPAAIQPASSPQPSSATHAGAACAGDERSAGGAGAQEASAHSVQEAGQHQPAGPGASASASASASQQRELMEDGGRQLPPQHAAAYAQLLANLSVASEEGCAAVWTHAWPHALLLLLRQLPGASPPPCGHAAMASCGDGRRPGLARP